MTRDAEHEPRPARAPAVKPKPVVGSGPRPKRDAPAAVPAAAAEPLAGNYEVDPHALVIRVRRSWLAEDPEARMLELLRALQAAGQLTWATPAALRKVAALTSRPRGDAEVIRIEVGIDVFALMVCHRRARRWSSRRTAGSRCCSGSMALTLRACGSRAPTPHAR